MRITYDNTPVLKNVTHDKLVKWGLPYDFPKYDIHSLRSAFSMYRHQFQEIHIISTYFHEAVIKSPAKFIDLYNDIPSGDLNYTVKIKGTYIFKNWVAFIWIDKSINLEVFFLFNKKGVIYAYSLNDSLHNIEWVSNYCVDGDKKADILKLMSYPILYHMFKYNADIELRFIAKDKKVKLKTELQPIQNKIDSDLIYLDCKWFTDIIRDKAFSVVGHLRDYGLKLNSEGKWYHHIVPVKPHMRSGWKHKANKTKIKQNENTCPPKEN